MAFDPYAVWLGIPPERRPPSHYDLFGLEPFTADAATIDRVSITRINRVRPHEAGPHADAAHALLAELNRARRQLLDPESRAAYDAKLRARLGEPSPATTPQPEPPEQGGLDDLKLEPDAEIFTLRPRPARGRQGAWFCGLAIPMLLVLLYLRWSRSAPEPAPAPAPPIPPPAVVQQPGGVPLGRPEPKPEAPIQLADAREPGPAPEPQPGFDPGPIEPDAAADPVSGPGDIRPLDEARKRELDERQAEFIRRGGSPVVGSRKPAAGAPDAAKADPTDPLSQVATDLDAARTRYEAAIKDAVGIAREKLALIEGGLRPRAKQSAEAGQRLKRLVDAREAFGETWALPRELDAVADLFAKAARPAVEEWDTALGMAIAAYGLAGAADRARPLEDERAKLNEKAKAPASPIGFNAAGECIILPTAEAGRPRWWFSLQQPPAGWTAPQFNDAAWRVDSAGFGAKGTPNVKLNTPWQTPRIWLRTKIKIPRILPGDVVFLRLYHDEAVEISADGSPLLSLPGYTTHYENHPLDARQVGLLREGELTLAATCSNLGGGQAFDMGLVVLRPSLRDPKFDEPPRTLAGQLKARMETDSVVPVRSGRDHFAAHSCYFRAFFDPWLKAWSDGDKDYLGRLGPRWNVITTHPLSPETPATLDFSSGARASC
jgi:hypothetical protein